MKVIKAECPSLMNNIKVIGKKVVQNNHGCKMHALTVSCVFLCS